MKNIISFFFLIQLSVFALNPKEEMRNLILDIRDKSPEKFIIIPQNGTDIYFSNGKLDFKLIDAIDGVTQESLKYGVPTYGEKTPTREYKDLLSNLREIKESGKTIFTVNYVDSIFGKWRSRSVAKKEGFLNYSAVEREVTTIVKDPDFKNNNDILKLEDAKNFLYLLNPENFKHKAEYIDKLSKTTYDVLIIDLYFKGIQLSSKDIEKLKTKPQGGKRLVIGYFSVGEAEDYRQYWKSEWDKKLPTWILYENKYWDGNYIVKYWDPQWKDLIFEMLNKYVESKFDGVFLDTIDTYESL